MISHHLAITLYKDVIALFCAASLAISSPAGITVDKNLKGRDTGVHIRTELWPYLRKGINYLEASGEEVPTYFMHSGQKAYGPLALTPIAIEDVKKHYPYLSGIRMEEVILDRNLYEMFALFYAELLLRHYLKLDYLNMDKEEVFKILQKAWFLGPTLYLKGRTIIATREARAADYIRGIMS
jgi:hypothetical protein